MTLGLGTRVAGKVLGEYLSGAGKEILGAAKGLGSTVAGKVANIPLLQQIGAGTAEEAAKGIVSNPLLRRASAVLPVSVPAWQAGAQALPGIAGGLTTAGVGYGGYQLLSGLSKGIDTQSARAVPFSTQQYVPGTLPMTNEQMGDYYLNEQRYLQQLALIDARQSASQYQRGPAQSSSISDAISQAWMQPVNYE